MRFTDFSVRSTKIIKTQGETLKKKNLKISWLLSEYTKCIRFTIF